MRVEGKGSIEPLDRTKTGNKVPASRCRHWRVTVSMGRDPQRPGKYLKKSQKITGSKDDALAALDALCMEAELAPYSSSFSKFTTVSQYATHYLEYEEARAAKAKRTIDGLGNRLAYVTDLLGNMYVKDITRKVIEQAYADMSKGYNLDGSRTLYGMDGMPTETKRGMRPLSGKSVLGVHKALSGMLKEASRDGLFDYSVFQSVRPPKNDTKERESLSGDQVAKLLETLDPTRHFDLAAILCVTCGLRRSEALALQWGDIDGERIKVLRALEEDGSEKGTKSASGKRVVMAPSPAKKALEAARSYQEAMFSELGINDSSKHPVCWCNPWETLTPHAFTRWWSRNRKALGLEGVRIHDLRHTYATLLALSGTDLKTIQELLGDSTAEVVLQVYTHTNDEAKREAARKIGQAISA